MILMAQRKSDKLALSVPPDIKEILGPPPILSSEDAAIYDAMLSWFAHDIAPADVIAWMLVKDLVDLRIELARYRRLKTGIMQNAYEKHIEHEIDKARLEAGAECERLPEVAA